MIAGTAAALPWILPLAILAGGCRAPDGKMNSVQRAAWDREHSEARTEWQRADKELWLIEERTRQVRRKTQQTLGDLELAQARQGEEAAVLGAALQTLAAMEEDLVAATLRKGEIETEMAEVRDLEQQLADRERRCAELTGRVEALDADLAARQAALAAKREAVAELLAAVEKESAALGATEKVLRAGLEAARGLVPASETPTGKATGGAATAEPKK